MKPRIQRVLTSWKTGFMAFGTGLEQHGIGARPPGGTHYGGLYLKYEIAFEV